MTHCGTHCGSTSVLVVEDEPLLRMAAVDLLQDAGFTVEEAGSGREALAVLRRQPDLHVLFTDIHMPGGMDGLALARQAARDFPCIGLVLVSGHTRPDGSQMPPGAVFISKPYEARKVLDHIRRARRVA